MSADGPGGATNPESASRRVTAIIQGRVAAVRQIRSSRLADASSIQCTSSISSRVGRAITRSSSCAITSFSLARRKLSDIRSTSGVGSVSMSSGAPISGSQATSSGAARFTTWASCDASASAPRSSSERSSGRSAAYGVSRSYSSQAAERTANVPASDRTSSSIRDLPIPASPTISSTPPSPLVAAESRPAAVASSSSRPTIGRSIDAASRRPSTPSRATARTGAFLPLTWNGSSGRIRNATGDASTTWGATIACPGSARAISLAARLTVSPITV